LCTLNVERKIKMKALFEKDMYVVAKDSHGEQVVGKIQKLSRKFTEVQSKKGHTISLDSPELEKFNQENSTLTIKENPVHVEDNGMIYTVMTPSFSYASTFSENDISPLSEEIVEIGERLDKKMELFAGIITDNMLRKNIDYLNGLYVEKRYNEEKERALEISNKTYDFLAELQERFEGLFETELIPSESVLEFIVYPLSKNENENDHDKEFRESRRVFIKLKNQRKGKREVMSISVNALDDNNYDKEVDLKNIDEALKIIRTFVGYGVGHLYSPELVLQHNA